MDAELFALSFEADSHREKGTRWMTQYRLLERQFNAFREEGYGFLLKTSPHTLAEVERTAANMRDTIARMESMCRAIQAHRVKVLGEAPPNSDPA